MPWHGSRELDDVMSNATHVTVDGNEAVASIAYRVSELIAIYPITPASAMAPSTRSWRLTRDSGLCIASILDAWPKGSPRSSLMAIYQGFARTGRGGTDDEASIGS